MENTEISAFLLDQIESHIHYYFIDSVKLPGTRVINIPGVFTSVCQLCNVGIMKLFKARLVGQCQAWKIAEYTPLEVQEKFQFLVLWKCLDGLMKFGKEFPS